jgi:hypothetical protein
MKRIAWCSAALAALMLASIGVARDGSTDIVTERLMYHSGTTDFDEVFPVTERLNQILADIARIEVEAQRGVPSFIVYPYDPTGVNGEPYALAWSDGAYTMSERIPPDSSTFLIYDPRRLSLADSSVEEGQQVEYRHFVLSYGINKAPQTNGAILDPATRLEPTERSLYISREIVGSRSPTAERIICFPRLEIPKDFHGETVRVIALQVESALHAAAEKQVDAQAESDSPVRSSGLERFFFRVK